jgi:NAD(P)-dependent dehydrogenase (short-subunit alcohol dehydrogenase family)
MLYYIQGWNAVIETNLTGTFLMSREVYRQYFSQHGGAIVNIIADMFRGFPLMAHTGETRCYDKAHAHVASEVALL